jgi:ribonuclease E
VETRLRDALRQDRARVQFGTISKFGLLEMSRQRLRPSLSEGSHVTCPRCNGTGHIRDTESSALQILRMVQEESMKDGTAAVHVQVPVEVTSFLLNEKRTEITKIELKQRVTVLLVPNKNLETPNYRLERLRHDDPRLENLQASYTMIDELDEEVGFTRREKAKERQQPLIKGILPEGPAPVAAPRRTINVEPHPQQTYAAQGLQPAAASMAPEAFSLAPQVPAGGGFFKWVKRLFGSSGSALPEPAAPEATTAPSTPATTSSSAISPHTTPPGTGRSAASQTPEGAYRNRPIRAGGEAGPRNGRGTEGRRDGRRGEGDRSERGERNERGGSSERSSGRGRRPDRGSALASPSEASSASNFRRSTEDAPLISAASESAADTPRAFETRNPAPPRAGRESFESRSNRPPQDDSSLSAGLVPSSRLSATDVTDPARSSPPLANTSKVATAEPATPVPRGSESSSLRPAMFTLADEVASQMTSPARWAPVAGETNEESGRRGGRSRRGGRGRGGRGDRGANGRDDAAPATEREEGTERALFDSSTLDTSLRTIDLSLPESARSDLAEAGAHTTAAFTAEQDERESHRPTRRGRSSASSRDTQAPDVTSHAEAQDWRAPQLEARSQHSSDEMGRSSPSSAPERQQPAPFRTTAINVVQAEVTSETPVYRPKEVGSVSQPLARWDEALPEVASAAAHDQQAVSMVRGETSGGEDPQATTTPSPSVVASPPAHEKTPGLSQAFSSPSGGLAQSDRSGGAHEKTPGLSQAFSSPSGGLAQSDVPTQDFASTKTSPWSTALQTTSGGIFVLPVAQLQSELLSAGLEWVNSDAHKIRAAQELMAQEAPASHVPRERKPLARAADGPLIMVETRKDLRHVKLPFEVSAGA